MAALSLGLKTLQSVSAYSKWLLMGPGGKIPAGDELSSLLLLKIKSFHLVIQSACIK